MLSCLLLWPQDTQHNDTRPNALNCDAQNNDSQYNFVLVMHFYCYAGCFYDVSVFCESTC